MNDVMARAATVGVFSMMAWCAAPVARAAPVDEVPAEASDQASDEASDAGGVIPTVMHTPVSSAVAGEAVAIEMRVAGDWQLAEMALRFRAADSQTWQTVPIERSRDGAWRARIPAEAVNGVGLAYYVESRGADGVVRQHFASAAEPHPIRVSGDSPSDTYRDQLARYGGARSRVRVDGWLVAYGSQPVEGGATDRFSDRLWQAEAEYVYRPLNWLHDMRVGFGLMRGSWPTVDGAAVSRADAPGLNYGYGEVNVELHRWFSVGGRLVLGASGLGFTAGAGAVARIGDITGTHFAARVTTVGDIGSETDLGFAWATVPRFPMALSIQFTDWPSGDADAANLTYDVGFEVDEMWTVNARVGSTGRANSLDGGFRAGVGVMADF